MPVNIDIELSGKLAEKDGLKKVIDELKAAFRKRLPEAAQPIEEKFVQEALTVRGPRSLGQVTGRLANALTVTPQQSRDFGGLNIDINDPVAQVYGAIQDDNKQWFQYGVEQTLEVIEQELERILIQSIKEVNSDG